MRFLENISLAVQSLRANKVRALLTMLGIIIGIAAVITIVTLGDSLTNSISSSMQEMGANNISVILQPKKSSQTPHMFSDMNQEYDSKDLITQDMLDSLLEASPNEIEALSYFDMVGSGRTSIGRQYANLSMMGVNKDYLRANYIRLKEGRFLSAQDEKQKKNVAVVSDKLAQNLFGEKPAVNQQITVKVNEHTATYTIVGVYFFDVTAMGAAMEYTRSADKDMSTSVFIPMGTASKMTQTKGLYSLSVLTAVGVDSIAFADEITAFFQPYYARNSNYHVAAFSMESMLETMYGMLNKVQIFIAAIAAISLVVGGIGVMNIMLAFITERTREIGIRKAIGATNTEIRTQFIVEAVLICAIGGIIGIALGITLGTIGAAIFGAKAQIKLSVIFLATGFSMAIGVFFGYYPANKAAKLNPIEALRHK